MVCSSRILASCRVSSRECSVLSEKRKPPNPENIKHSTLNLYHLEIVLPRAAFGTRPVHRHVVPFRTGRDAFFGDAGSFVIDEAADEAHIGFEYLRVRSSGHVGREREEGNGVKIRF